ncbi:helix-turn-helix transcriptional regulator [Streptomyces sp. N2-109]|uniref:Helix-turn-helix transcriptional regulator n=1 Tax=Streptomyces gossypii TaxID=2883101 RepID=A0ABT2JTJ4_9ACTN|nr:helix-turn-helix transcriptional regulator [Streptomyces gossypii]MCT2591086.1 helix-turn-helix transcriptional regulator [Streptomyces gossypii]
MNESEPLYKLVSSTLLRTLMERTGTGAPISLRELARRAGIARSSLHALLHEMQEAVPASEAHGIAQTIGVDLLILFAPVGRTVELDHPLAVAVPA